MQIRKVNVSDVTLLRELAQMCKPLDVHTPYTYWVMCNFFGDGCFILQDDSAPVGYIMTLIKENTLFIWQIGIVEGYRGQNYSSDLLEAVTQYAREKHLAKMQVSIAPENANSYHAFHRFCLHKNIPITNVGEVDIRIPSEDFREYEDIYEMIL